MKQTLLSLLVLGWMLTGCTSNPPSGSTYTHRSGLAGPDLDMTIDNLLESSEDRSYLVWLNAVRIREGAWDARYYLEVRYQGASDAGFMEIGPGETLVLTIDGQPVKFRGAGSLDNRERSSRESYVENAVYEAKPEDLKKIARAKDVKVQIIGSARKLYREFNPENIRRFRSFVLLHMGGL